MLARGRRALPEKIMSSVRLPRNNEYDCSPSAQRMLSATLDLPLPFGPMTAVMPSANSNMVFEAKVLYPVRVNRFKRM